MKMLERKMANSRVGMLAAMCSALAVSCNSSQYSSRAISHGSRDGAMNNAVLVQFPDSQSSGTNLAGAGQDSTGGAVAVDTSALPPSGTGQAANLSVQCLNAPIPSDSQGSVQAQSPGTNSTPPTTSTGLSDQGQAPDGDEGWHHHGHYWGAAGSRQPFKYGGAGAPGVSGAVFAVNLKDQSGQVIQSVSQPINCPAMVITLPGLADGAYDLAASVTDAQTNVLYQGDSGPFSMDGGKFSTQVVLNMTPMNAAGANSIVVNFPRDLGAVGVPQCNQFHSHGRAQANVTGASQCQMPITLTISDAVTKQPLTAGTIQLFAVHQESVSPGSADPTAWIFHGLDAISLATAPLITANIQNGVVDLGSVNFGLYSLEIASNGYLSQHAMLPVLPHHGARDVILVKPVPTTLAADKASCLAQGHFYNPNRAICDANTTIVSKCDVSNLKTMIAQSTKFTDAVKQSALNFIQQNPTRFDGTLYSYQACFTTQFGFRAILTSKDSHSSSPDVHVSIPK